MANEKDEFNLVNTPEVVDETISKDDFKFVQADKKIHDQKFQTKPTTFLKDSLKRFSKNKSSLVAAGILGVLLLMSIVVPLFGTKGTVHDASHSNTTITWLEPKLFKAGTGFWDGTKKVSNISVDISSDPEGLDKKNNWWPDPDTYDKGAVDIDSKVFTDEQYTDEAMVFGKGGYVEFGYYNDIKDDKAFVNMDTEEFEDFDLNVNHFVTNFDVYNLEKLENSNETIKVLPNDYVEGKCALYFVFLYNGTDYYVPLTEYKTSHDIGTNEETINISDKVKEFMASNSLTGTVLDSAYLQVRVLNQLDHLNNCVLIKSLNLETESTDEKFASLFKACSFEDGNSAMIRKSTDAGYWTRMSPSFAKAYLSKSVLCSFTYDTYEAALGHKWMDAFPVTTLNKYKRNKWVRYSYDYEYVDGKCKIIEGTWNFKILEEEKVAFTEEEGIKEEDVILDEFGEIEQISCYVMKYKYDFGLEKMPKFLLGTDKSGRDMLIYTFVGLRTSLLIGVATTIICFIFGLFWGSVSGYFGGAVDLAMERFTDIISGVPWIVVMTLVIINMGANFWTFALALCLTGWIGTAATTRTQFYRFRGREYVLASRTLGATHGRLIVKHILPNAMGTIITSAVLMVPSVIFSEATISYLGLAKFSADDGYSSLGVILSNNQGELTNHPYLLIFPAIIIALVMISFNLAGNGLRDAVNPSLKGEGE